MRAHIDGCDEHATKAAELRAVALQMHDLAEPVAAPAALRGRVLDAVAREAAAPATEPRQIRDGASRGGSARVLWARPRSWASPWGALAAALVLALGGLLTWNVTLMNRDDANVDRLATRATSVSTLRGSVGGAAGTVVYFGDDKKALVIVDGLPQLDASKNVYQMWAVGEANPTSLGLMQADASGHTKTVVPIDAARTGTIAITVEPAGGSAQPTTKPILSANCVVQSPGCAS
jgi:anti-sigma-K factor RskA